MKRSLRRADLDDESPAFVAEPAVKVPVCCRCGREVPHAKSLWTLCGPCGDRDLEITPTTQKPGDPQAMIGNLARKMALSLTPAEADRVIPPAAVLHHIERFRGRGMDEAAARRLAESLAMDHLHRESCDVCRGNAAEIEEKLLAPQAEVERLAHIGKACLPRRQNPHAGRRFAG